MTNPTSPPVTAEQIAIGWKIHHDWHQGELPVEQEMPEAMFLAMLKAHKPAGLVLDSFDPHGDGDGGELFVYPPTPVGDEVVERWAEIQDDPNAIVACGERWKRIAAIIGCRLHGFNDGRSASFFTPDGNVIEIGPKFRAAIKSLGLGIGQ